MFDHTISMESHVKTYYSWLSECYIYIHCGKFRILIYIYIYTKCQMKVLYIYIQLKHFSTSDVSRFIDSRSHLFVYSLYCIMCIWEAFMYTKKRIGGSLFCRPCSWINKKKKARGLGILILNATIRKGTRGREKDLSG